MLLYKPRVDGMNRRDFLRFLSSGACCAAAAGTLGPRFAHGQSATGSGKSAIFYNLFGGNDPLNSFAVPYSLSAYYDIRPSTGIAEADVLKLNGNNQIGFHPVLTTFQRLYNEGDVAIVHGTGDPVGTRSHFTSQDIMSKGTSQINSSNKGWLGILGDLYFREIEVNTIGLGGGNPIVLSGDRVNNSPLAIGSLQDVNYGRVYDLQGVEQDKLLEYAKRLRGATSGLEAVHDSARNVLAQSSELINPAVDAFQSVSTYDSSPLSNYFKQVSTVLSAGIGTKVFYGGVGGWDFHDNILSRQQSLLSILNVGLTHFEADMKAKGLWDDMVFCIFTEFGRTTYENTKLDGTPAGTDHGWGSTMILIGGEVNGGTYGAENTNSDLRDRRWLYQEHDSRSVFSEIINYMGFDPSPVFPEQFTNQPLGLLS